MTLNLRDAHLVSERADLVSLTDLTLSRTELTWRLAELTVSLTSESDREPDPARLREA